MTASAGSQFDAHRLVLANPRVPFYGVVLAATLAEQGRRDEAARVVSESAARHPAYRQSSIAGY